MPMTRITRATGRRQSNLDAIHLPPEIISLITDELEDDPVSLKACTLTSLAWSPRARDLLYRRLQLGDPKPKVRCRELRKIFASRPNLPGSTHTLTIVENAKRHKDEYGDGWLKTCKDVISLLPLFTSVRRVSLKCEPGILNWTLLPPALKVALFDLFSRPHVKEIELANIFYFPITPFIHYHHLEALILENIETDLSEEDAFLPLNYIPRLGGGEPEPKGLRVLDVCGSGFALTTLFKCLDSIGVQQDSRLMALNPFRPKELWWKMLDGIDSSDPIEEQAWSTIYTRCCSQVEYFNVIEESFWPLSPSVADTIFKLQNFPNLTTLDVSFVSECFFHDDSGLGRALATGLAALSNEASRPPLTTFLFGIDCRPVGNSHAGWSILSEFMDIRTDRTVIRRLNDILSNVEAFPRLTRFSVTLDVTHRGFRDEEWPLVREGFEGALSKLGHEGRDILTLAYVRQRPDDE